jgi:hypothetical protein
LQQAQAEARELRVKNALKDGIQQSRLRPYDTAVIEKLLRLDADIRVDATGTVTAAGLDGQRVNISDAVRLLETKHPNLFEAPLDSYRKPEPQRGKLEMSTAEKLRFIDEHGSDSFEKLPLRARMNAVPETLQEYKQLSICEKSGLIAKYGESFIQRLLNDDRAACDERRREHQRQLIQEQTRRPGGGF